MDSAAKLKLTKDMKLHRPEVKVMHNVSLTRKKYYYKITALTDWGFTLLHFVIAYLLWMF